MLHVEYLLADDSYAKQSLIFTEISIKKDSVTYVVCGSHDWSLKG